MSHLTHFGVGNFKVFNELTDFELAPLTILTGKNNSGKSSLLKALLLFKKNLKPNTFKWGNDFNTSFEELEFGFPELRLGSANEIFNYNTPSPYQSISFNFGIDSFMFPKGILNLWYSIEDTNEILRLKGFAIMKDNKPIISFLNEIELKEECFQIDFQYFIDRIREAQKQSSKTDMKDFGEKIGYLKRKDSYRYKDFKTLKICRTYF
jgi:AAA15 family ATPase/GTPase